MTTSEKVAYLKGLAKGLGVDQDLPQAVKLGAELLAQKLLPQVLDNYGCQAELDMLRALLDEITE